MATADTHGYGTPTSSMTTTENRTAGLAAGGSWTGVIAGVAVLALAITALAGRFPTTLLAIAVIVFGVGMLFEGASVAARYARVLMSASTQRSMGVDLGGGLSTEFAGGAAAIILGILSLLNIYPNVLLPIAAIVVGAALLLGAASMRALNDMVVEHHFSGAAYGATRQVASAAVGAASGTSVLVGIAALVLGIIGVASGAGILGLILTEVAFLCLGATMIVSGCAVGSKMITMLHEEQRTV
jgi:hypothetical protein